MEEEETPGKHPELMALMTETSEEVESGCAEKCVQTDFTFAAQTNPLWKPIVGSVGIFIVITFVIIFADALAKQRSEPLHSVPPCPTDWFGFQGMCYYFSQEKRNWTSSQSFCLSQKASLLTFNPSLEKDFVVLHKGKGPFWIGLKREPNQPWKWTNGENSTLEVTGEGHCVYLNNEATPIALRCRTSLFWICRKAEAS